MDVHLVMPVGIEERREHLLDLCLGQLFGLAPSEVERTVRGAVQQVVVDLAEQHGREIERDMHVVFGGKSSHRVVVANRVQADPRIAVASGCGRIAIERLMLVP